ncbi:MAG TPA: hypothetical protein VK911_16825, partial [Vicinamibacterales bacterium]|nr:hypothetical protein [Vicinamibacterales bacterium]
LTGEEEYRVTGIADGLRSAGEVPVEATARDGKTTRFAALVRIDTPEELSAFRAGGILPYVLRQLVGGRG